MSLITSEEQRFLTVERSVEPSTSLLRFSPDQMLSKRHESF